MEFNNLIEYIQTVYENDYLLKKLSDDKNINAQILMNHYFNEYFVPEIELLLEKSKIEYRKNVINGNFMITNNEETYEIATLPQSYKENNKKLIWKLN